VKINPDIYIATVNQAKPVRILAGRQGLGGGEPEKAQADYDRNLNCFTRSCFRNRISSVSIRP